MKVHITFDLGEYTRRAIGHRFGKKAATWSECKRMIEGLVEGDLQQIELDYDHHLREVQPSRRRAPVSEL